MVRDAVVNLDTIIKHLTQPLAEEQASHNSNSDDIYCCALLACGTCMMAHLHKLQQPDVQRKILAIL